MARVTVCVHGTTVRIGLDGRTLYMARGASGARVIRALGALGIGEGCVEVELDRLLPIMPRGARRAITQRLKQPQDLKT